MAQVRKQCADGNPIYGGIDSLEKLEVNMEANCIPQEIFDMDYTLFEDFLGLASPDGTKIRRYYEMLR